MRMSDSILVIAQLELTSLRNVVRMLTAANPTFFTGTAVEAPLRHAALVA